jgi:hypothetical protein
MKRISIIVLIASSFIMLGASSCGKENLSSISKPPPPPPHPTTFSLSLVANHWTQTGAGIYVDNFEGIIPAANVNGKSNVKIYLVESQEEIQINNSIHFMGNELWASSILSDIAINYRCDSTALPFAYLEIKVVVE